MSEVNPQNLQPPLPEAAVIQNPALSQTNQQVAGKNTSRSVMLLFLFFFPPVAWYLMWKESYYHKWLPAQLWFFGIMTIVFTSTILFFVTPQLEILYSSLNVEREKSILDFSPYLFIVFGVIEIFFGIYLYLKLKKQPKLTSHLFFIAAMVLILHFVMIVVSEIWALSSVITPIYNLTSSINGTSQPQPVQAFTPESQTKQIQPVSKDWKTYVNEKFGFSFQYPSVLSNHLTENTWGINLDCGCMVFSGLEIEVINSSLSPQQWWDANSKKVFNGEMGINNKYHPMLKYTSSVTTKKIGAKDVIAIQAKGPEIIRNPDIQHSYLARQEVYEVYLYSENQKIFLITNYLSIPEVDQILSTFKFIE